MFSIRNQEVTLTNLNTKPEKHGDEPVPATYAKIKWKTANTILDVFDPGLRAALFRAPDQGEQGSLDADHMPELRFPKMEPSIGHKWEGAGYKLRVSIGVSGQEDVTAQAVTLDELGFELADGGTVVVTLRMVMHLDAEREGKLAMLQQREITVTLTPPTKEEIKALEESKKPKQRELETA